MAYGLGSHPVDWQVLGGLLAVAVAVWAYTAAKLALAMRRGK